MILWLDICTQLESPSFMYSPFHNYLPLFSVHWITVLNYPTGCTHKVASTVRWLGWRPTVNRTLSSVSILEVVEEARWGKLLLVGEGEAEELGEVGKRKFALEEGGQGQGRPAGQTSYQRGRRSVLFVELMQRPGKHPR